MSKRILFYLVAAISSLSLQSCVTNYVVAEPITYISANKSGAKFASVDTQKAENDKKELINAFLNYSSTKKPEVASIEVKRENTAVVSKRNLTIDGILKEAETYLGTPYRFGGMSRSGIDCSAFVLSAFAKEGITLPRVAASQALQGERIDRENLQKGDLLFFSQGGGRISHVAIVYEVTADDEIRFIHSASSKGVSFSSLSSSYWSPKFRFGKRIIDENFSGASNLAVLN